MRWTLPPRAVINVLLAAVTLRWIGLEAQSLWLDEGITWSWATAPTWRDTVLAEANHPPVWWIVTRLSVALLGASEEALRILEDGDDVARDAVRAPDHLDAHVVAVEVGKIALNEDVQQGE